ncbi:MAG: phosphoribosylanthranilate isomerase [Methanomicrobiales archaeon]|nr:phosphoribosylanthranilate isomerase [Methanomicrobiales archaeon]NYT20322.1 phosphoribosylanthranilate isomerase [Methanomicrobiales archaeon]
MKICGITTPEDARIAEAAGADLIGVVLHSASPRCITPELAREIFETVPAMTRVCVTHAVRPSDLREICALRPDAIQVSCFAPVPDECRARVIRMVAPGNPLPPDADAYLVDGSRGTGKPYDASFASAVVSESAVPVLLAGGLSPGNVAAAILDVRPCGVDVASGVEYSPGRKDPGKVRAFVTAAKRVMG